jgi:large subunit ribosomal protein L18
MANGPRYHVAYRRRREGKTDYKRRLALLKSRTPRAVIRKSLSGTIVQIVDFTPEGDKVLAQASYSDLRKMGWEFSVKDTTATYLTGLIAGKRALSADVSEAVLDIGLNEPVKGSKVFTALKGLLDAGMEIPHGAEIFPSDERISGEWRNDTKFSSAFTEIKTRIMEASE